MNIKFLGLKFKLKVALAIFSLGVIIGGSLLCNCSKNGVEGFAPIEKEIDISKLPKHVVNTSETWTNNAKKFAESNVNQDHNIRNQTYNGKNLFKHNNEAFFLTETHSSPECCPSIYSNSGGCLCTTPEQDKFLNNRGENRDKGLF